MKPALHDIDFATLGFYEPGFIHLRINTSDDLSDLIKLAQCTVSAKWMPTFLHEYIHFLQDITSTQGLLNFIHVVEALKNANKQVNEAGQAEFPIPLRISNDFNWGTNTKLKRIYRGVETPVRSACYLGYKVAREEITASDGKKINAPKYLVKYYDDGAKTTETCHFGSIHLKEYMAHAVQNQFAPGTTHDDIPYRLVELIVAKEFPRLARDSALLVALCDAALMDLHPARLFFRTLERMKERHKRNFKDVNAVYTFAFKDVSFADGQRSETIDSLYEDMTRRAIAEFRDSLKADIFKDNVQWFEELMGEAKKLRVNSRGFFTQLVSSPGVFSAMFHQVVAALGIPFTTNADSHGYFFPSEKLQSVQIYGYYPKVFQAICKTYEGESQCALHPFCVASEAKTDKTITNEQCLHTPWARVDLPTLCPYAQMWKTWGLAGKRPAA